MFEKKLLNQLDKAQKEQNSKRTPNFYNDNFKDLNKLILKNLNNNKKLTIIIKHFDKIIPFITLSNIDNIMLYTNLFIKNPQFKENFIKGIKNYPYKDCLSFLLYKLNIGLGDNFDNFYDNNVLKELSKLELSEKLIKDILNTLNEEKQAYFLKLLSNNNCDIPYFMIDYKGNNKNIIFDNLSSYIKRSNDLFKLRDFAKSDPNSYLMVKNYIDNNPDKLIKFILSKFEDLNEINDPSLIETIKILILEVSKNENVNLSDITLERGGYSLILFIGNKVFKIGSERGTEKLPNNPYIIKPLLRTRLESNGQSCFVEITEKVNTKERPSYEELYQIYKNLRDLGLVWTDVKDKNVGRLIRDNKIYWNENIEPTDEVLNFDSKRGNDTLKSGDLVILDADFIFDENDPNIKYTNNKNTSFEERYKKESNRKGR